MNETGKRKDDNIGFLARHWPIITTITLVVMGYSVLNATVSFHEARICKVEQKVEDIPVIRERIENMNIILRDIKEKLDKR